MCLGDVAIQAVGARQPDHEIINKRRYQPPFNLPSLSLPSLLPYISLYFTTTEVSSMHSTRDLDAIEDDAQCSSDVNQIWREYLF